MTIASHSVVILSLLTLGCDNITLNCDVIILPVDYQRLVCEVIIFGDDVITCGDVTVFDSAVVTYGGANHFW